MNAIPGIPGPYGGPDPAIPISQLPPLPLPIFGDEEVAVVQNGVTYRATAAQISASKFGPPPPPTTLPSLYYVANAGQTVFSLFVHDQYGNTGNLQTSAAIAVYRNGIRLAPDNGGGWGGFVISVPGNSITLVLPAGSGEVIIVSWGQP